ncbi:MAG TPA: helix-turn-helix domain-containing protein [Pseudonocardia sp.]|jgi:hypothetical protein|nr:helix-turn-helix domain-containing protein [Pseudonocardia sp.]
MVTRAGDSRAGDSRAGHSRAGATQTWHRLLDELFDHRAEIVDELSRRMRDQLSVYRELSPELFHRHLVMAVETTVRVARTSPPQLSAEQAQTLEEVGEAQARIGVPVDQMLLAWRIGADLLVERGSAAALRLAVDSQQLLGFVLGTLASSDVGMITTARAHRRAERARDREAQDRDATFVRAVLFGSGDPGELRAMAASYGLHPTRRYHAVRARPAPDGSWHEVQRAIGLTGAAKTGQGMSVLVDGDLAGFQTAEPGDASPGLAGVGPAVPLDGLAESFGLATRALRTAHAFGLAGTHDLAGLGLRAAVVADADVGAALRRRYLDPLAESGSGTEIIATLREYLAAGSHVDTAAERLHIHANTLRYRLARFEELTGAHLRGPLTAFEVWWAVESAALMEAATNRVG